MKLYEYQIYLLSSKLTTKELDVRETDKSYLAKGMRISKERLDRPERTFRMYSLNNDKETKNKFLKHVLQYYSNGFDTLRKEIEAQIED